MQGGILRVRKLVLVRFQTRLEGGALKYQNFGEGVARATIRD